jgi:predicted AlkP superfamily phosphohydrolase/phosphomutase
VAVIGLDCGTPEILFNRFAEDMPTLTAFRERALWGPMRSVVPPITVPAWSCMFSGRTPGELGIYGFRNRTDHSYSGMSLATSRNVRVPRLWDRLSSLDKESVLLAVPGTYPPPAVRGCVVADFLAPSNRVPDFTRPPALAEEVRDVVGDFALDIENFRTEDKERVARGLFDLTEQRFRLGRHLSTSHDWSLFAMVDIGPDRLHHGFWASCDPDHPRHDPGNRYVNIFRDYYRALDRHLAELLATFDDDTAVLVVSDHGAQPMLGGFCLNEWLRQEGFLVLREPLRGRTPIREAPIDWTRTSAWGDGGYYGRIFLNVSGREPAGQIAPADYESVRQQLIDSLNSLPDHEGRHMGNRAMRPEEIYPEVHGVAPDLIVYLGDLRWRAVGVLGLERGLFTFENDTGPDDANHSEHGIFALAGDGLPVGRCNDLSLLDVAPTLQAILGIHQLPSQRGQIAWTRSHDGIPTAATHSARACAPGRMAPSESPVTVR